MTHKERFFMEMSISNLRDTAQQNNDLHDEAAARVFIERLTDMELERRLCLMHNNPGFSPVSVTAMAGEVRSENYFKQSSEPVGANTSTFWHDYAKKTLSHLKPRQKAAILIRKAKDDEKIQGVWAKTYDEISDTQSYYLNMLGFEGSERLAIRFSNGRSIRKAALEGRTEMILMAKAGVI